METLQEKIGAKIKFYRKHRGLTLLEMSELLHKSKATLSKYENGQIIVDIVTLYEIASVLNVHVEQLLHSEPQKFSLPQAENAPAFFNGINQFYMYYYDGRNNAINTSVIDILSPVTPAKSKIMMYMNIPNYNHYQLCENTYYGYLEHFDALSKLTLQHQSNRMEQIAITVLASFMDAPFKWGLFYGISSRPMMPVATKVMLSPSIQPLTKELLEQLRISKEDIRIMKLYNMLCIS